VFVVLSEEWVPNDKRAVPDPVNFKKKSCQDWVLLRRMSPTVTGRFKVL